MKTLCINRRSILRAIHAATIALLTLAASHRAIAQVTLPFQQSSNTITTASGSYANEAGVYEPMTTYTSITIGAGTTVNATQAFGGSGAYNADPYSLITAGASSFSNSGTLTLIAANGSGSGAYQATVFINNGAASVTGTNSGYIKSDLTGGNVHQSLELETTTGNISMTNSGTLVAQHSNVGYDLELLSTTSGNIIFTNTASGLISVPNTGAGVYAKTAGTGTASLTNAGTISVTTGNGIQYSGASGDVTAANSGTINVSGYGFEMDTGAGNITLSNTGTITAQTGLYGDSSGGNVSATNQATINASRYGIEAYSSSGAAMSVNTGTISGASSVAIYVGGTTVVGSNSGLITDSGSGMYSYSTTGSATLTNTGTITSCSYGIKFDAGSGATTATNSGLIDVTTSGIVISGNGTVINSGTIMHQNTGILVTGIGHVTDSGNISGGPIAINVQSGSSVTITGSPTITGTILGGATQSSTSTIAFDLTVPANQVAADRAQLAADITAYAHQGGGTLTFEIGALSYTIDNFSTSGITSDLTGSGGGGGGGGGGMAHYARFHGFQSIGTVLDELATSANPDAVNLLASLNAVPNAAVPGALTELSPKSLQALRNVAFDNNTFNDTTVNNHLTNRRDGLTGFDSSALQVNDSNTDPSLSPIRDHLLAYTPVLRPGVLSDTVDPVIGAASLRDEDSKDMKSVQVTTVPPDRWSTFIAGNVILASLSNALPFQNADYTTGQVMAGADYRLDDHFTVGALLSYAHTQLHLDERSSKADIDSFTPGVYASFVDGAWYANGLATYVRNAYSEDRMVDIPGITGDNHGNANGNQGTGDFTGGYEFQRGDFKFGPVATVEYVHLAIQQINEDGPTALDIGAQDQDSLRSLVGFEGRYAALVDGPGGKWILTPRLSASWQHEYLDNSNGIVSQFNGAGGGSFSVNTDSPDRDSAFIDAGLDASAQDVTFFVDYMTQVGQADFYAQSAQGGVRVGF